MARRVVLIVLDSFGIGEESDACLLSAEGSNVVCADVTSPHFPIMNATRLQKRGQDKSFGLLVGRIFMTMLSYAQMRPRETRTCRLMPVAA